MNMKTAGLAMAAAVAEILSTFVIADYMRPAVATENSAGSTRPVLTIDDALLTIAPKGEDWKAGDKLVLEVVGVNHGEKDHVLNLCLLANVTRPTSMLSRLPAMPRQIWTHQLVMKLKAGETKTLEIPMEAAIEEGVTRFWIQSGDLSQQLAEIPIQPASLAAPVNLQVLDERNELAVTDLTKLKNISFENPPMTPLPPAKGAN